MKIRENSQIKAVHPCPVARCDAGAYPRTRTMKIDYKWVTGGGGTIRSECMTRAVLTRHTRKWPRPDQRTTRSFINPTTPNPNLHIYIFIYCSFFSVVSESIPICPLRVILHIGALRAVPHANILSTQLVRYTQQ